MDETNPLIRHLMVGLASVKAGDEKRDQTLQDIQDQLAFVRAALEELLRRTPDRCAYCGESSRVHNQPDFDHEFMP